MITLRHLLNTVGTTIIALLSRIVPRTDSVWIFGGHKGLKYAGNSMFLFKYCVRHYGHQRHVIWLTTSEAVIREVTADGHEAHHIWGPKGIWLGLRARWHVFNIGPSDTGPTSCGAYQLNLWHGIPLKDIRFLRSSSEIRGYRDRINKWILRDKLRRRRLFILSPNHIYAQHMLDAFDVAHSQIVYANLPRNIVFECIENSQTWCKTTDRPVLERLQALTTEGARIIGYFPTWRGRGMNDLFLGAATLHEIDRINDYLQSRNLYLVTKWHDCTYHTYAHEGENYRAEDLINYLCNLSNIIVINFSSDLNSHLTYCNLLITDYSSVLFDWLLAQRPILFAPYDLDEYKKRWGFNFDYKSIVPGPIVLTIDQLLNALEIWVHNGDFGFSHRIEELRDTFFEFDANPERIISTMLHATDANHSSVSRGSLIIF